MNVQIIINTIISASIYTLIAYSFMLIYRIVRFFHFSHAAIFTYGAYLVYYFYKIINFPLPVAILLSVLFCGFLGGGINVFVYKPMRSYKAKPMVFMLASLGMLIILQNIISIIWGDDSKSIRKWSVNEGINIFGGYITEVQLIIVLSSIICVTITSLFFNHSSFGKVMRAVSNDSELGQISGINSEIIIVLTFILGSTLVSMAGILVALDMDMTPTMGMNALLMGVVVMIVSGNHRTGHLIVTSLLIAFTQQCVGWFISSQWQDAVAFLLLLIYLLKEKNNKIKSAIKV